VQTVESALAVDPAKRPQAAELAAELRSALTAPRREQRARPRPGARWHLNLRRPERLAPSIAPAALEARALSSGLAALFVVAGGSLLPFWTPGLLALLACTAAATAWRFPRAGLALALFAPLFAFGNEARGAAILYGALAVALLALAWRDPRAGLTFAAGPLLIPFGGVALVPLAVQPARGRLRRAVHAAIAVLAAGLVAGLHGRALPLTGARVGDLGVAAARDPGTVLSALASVLAANAALIAAALALAAAAALLPYARSRGTAAIGLLCAAEAAIVVAAAPAQATPVVLGAWLLCGVLTLGRSR
jgi:hypothetical protein